MARAQMALYFVGGGGGKGGGPAKRHLSPPLWRQQHGQEARRLRGEGDLGWARGEEPLPAVTTELFGGSAWWGRIGTLKLQLSTLNHRAHAGGSSHLRLELDAVYAIDVFDGNTSSNGIKQLTI